MIIGFDASRAFVFKRTGTENYSFNILVNLLQMDKKNVYKVYLRLPEEIRESKTKINEWLHNIKINLPLASNYQLVLLKNKRLWTQMGLARELWIRTPDVLFVPAHTLPIIRKHKMKTVVTIHDLGYEYLPQYHQFPQKIWLTWSTRYAVKFADRLIAVSNATKLDLINKLKAVSSKIFVVYEAYNEKLYAKAEYNKIHATQDKFSIVGEYLFFVSTIQPRKNVLNIIKSFNLVLNKYPNLKLVLVGKKGWLSDHVYAEPEKLDIAGKVFFLGHVDDPDTICLMSGAKMLLYPSLFEGFGLPILEAQACGIPVITSNFDPMMEVGGDACLYVDPNSVDKIAEGIIKVLDNQQFANNLVRSGFQNIKRFSWKKAAEETLVVLQSL